jgi:glycosyltransferase involved in cell wall biosynthesis
MSSPSRRLKILQVGSCFHGWGGAELHLVNLAEQLAARGHDVTVACQPGRFVEAEARRRRLKTFSAVVAKQSDWSSRRAYAPLMRRERFDVVHVHWAGDYVVAPFLARRVGVPAVIMSRHSPAPLKSGVGRYLYGRILFDRIIALSESVRRTLVGQGLPADRVVTIHHGTDTDAFRRTTVKPESARAEWGVPERGVSLLAGAAGRLAPEKGLICFLDALAKAPDTVRGVLIGDGPQEAELRAYADGLGLEKRVTFAGFRADVNNALAALDALVLASTWEEPCAAVVQQAMCLGKPVIGTNTGGTPEMVVDGETGILVPPGDAGALTEALRGLAGDAARRRRLGAAGRLRADALFTLSGMIDRIEALYNEVLARGGGSGARAGDIRSGTPSPS